MNKKICFFCGGEINQKASDEHIFGDAFLGRFGIKESSINSSQPRATTYSRIKVPAHKKCNGGAGSRFESLVLKIISYGEENEDFFGDINKYPHSSSIWPVASVISHWIAKLYFGLLYWEANLFNQVDKSRQADLLRQLDCPEFYYVKKCLIDELDFKLPSSRYYFSLPEPSDPELRFDFATGLPLGLFYIRFGRHLFVSALADGYLVSEWFSSAHAKAAQEFLNQHAQAEPFAYLRVVSEIWAVREWIPVVPNIEIDDGFVVDRSRLGFKERPPINEKMVRRRAEELFEEDLARWRSGRYS